MKKLRHITQYFKTALVGQFALVILLMACNSQNDKISIKNSSMFNYKDKLISMSWNKAKENHPWLHGDNFKIIDPRTKTEIAYQLEYLGTQTPINLLLQVSLKSNEKIELTFLQEKHSAFATKTYGRYVPERYDDFAWENDKIAYRVYGKALELVPNENAYGMDVWGKAHT